MKRLVLLCIALLWLVVPVSADVLVHDADGQYIGELVSVDATQVVAFVPALGLAVFIEDSGHVSNQYGTDTLYYENADCSGTAYAEYYNTTHWGNTGFLHWNSCFGFYKSSSTGQFIVDKAYKHMNSCVCNATPSNTTQRYVRTVTLIDAANVPFTNPIKMPVSLTYVPPGDVTGDSKVGLEDSLKILQTVANTP